MPLIEIDFLPLLKFLQINQIYVKINFGLAHCNYPLQNFSDKNLILEQMFS